MKPESMRDRVSRYNQLVVKAAQQWYAADGQWRKPNALPPVARERLWLCNSLLAEGETKLASAIISAMPIAPCTEQSDGVTHEFDIFHSNVSASLLCRYGKKVNPAARKMLTRLTEAGFAFYHGNRRPDFQFHGYNDNMPAEAALGLILGGEALGNREAVEYAVWNLRRLRDILARRGSISEWNSPTYTPVTLHAMAEIAAHAKHPVARDLAAKIEARIWLDLAARFHPALGVMSGPHSRAYNIDLLAQVSNAAAMFWFALGDLARPAPVEFFTDSVNDLELHHEGDFAFNVAQMAWFSSDTYHVPPAAERLFRAKKYPFRAATTAEAGDNGPSQQARAARLETWLAADYTVGTAAQMAPGQGTAYYVTYKLREPVRTFRDVGKLFQKFTINDEIPGAMAATLVDGQPCPEAAEQYFGSWSNTLTLTDGPTALVLTNPAVSLGGGEGRGEPKSLWRLEDMVLCPAHFGGAEEIIVGDRQRSHWAGGVAHGEWIGARRGKLLLAIRPLAFIGDPNPRRPVPLTLEKINRYEAIRMSFYRGAARTFTPAELRGMFGGFIAEHASTDEYPSLAAFLADLAEARFTDYHWIMRRTRYRRPATKRRPALELEISSSPGAFTSRYATVNGKLVNWHDPAQIDTLTVKDLPILNEPWESIPDFFPWPHFNTPWGIGTVSDAEDV
ncbi:MAG: hypothetical protein LBK71_05810 [Verrucomicrobiales bacterium]|nr:hypothetical protein [Verrucomicrobiales bacterium]